MRASRASLESFPEFLELWSKLKNACEGDGAILVVEGERDRRALRRLGLEGPILLVHRGASISATAQHLLHRGRRVIVLTDWDREGGVLARRLKEFLEAESVPLDLEYRRRLSRILRGEVVHVEGLFGWARRLAEMQGGSLEHALDALDAGPSPGPTG